MVPEMGTSKYWVLHKMKNEFIGDKERESKSFQAKETIEVKL